MLSMRSKGTEVSKRLRDDVQVSQYICLKFSLSSVAINLLPIFIPPSFMIDKHTLMLAIFATKLFGSPFTCSS